YRRCARRVRALTDAVQVTRDGVCIAPRRQLLQQIFECWSETQRRTSAMIHKLPMVTTIVWAVSLVAAPIMAQQAIEGAGKVLTAPAEVPKGTVDGTVEGAKQGAPVAGTVAGTVEGTGTAVRKTTRGAADVVEGTGKAVGDTLRGLSGKE